MENMTTSSPEKEKRPTLKSGLKELLSLSKEDVSKYFPDIDVYRTHIAVLKYARKEGYEEGFQIGRAERNKELIERLFSHGMKAKEIADLLNLETHAVEYVLTTPQE